MHFSVVLDVFFWISNDAALKSLALLSEKMMTVAYWFIGRKMYLNVLEYLFKTTTIVGTLCT